MNDSKDGQGPMGNQPLSSASLFASPSTTNPSETEGAEMVRAKFSKSGAYGYANVSQGVFRVETDGDEAVIDAVTASQLVEMGCCEIIGEVEEMPEPEPAEAEAEKKAEAKPKVRRRGRQSAEAAKD